MRYHLKKKFVTMIIMRVREKPKRK